MATTRPRSWKKFFTVEQANATLPLVGAIVRDIADLAGQMRSQAERLDRLRPANGERPDPDRAAEWQAAEQEFEQSQARMHEYEQELRGLGVELKDYNSGRVDFPCFVGDEESCMCWRLGEAAVAPPGSRPEATHPRR
jgi:hypothetical protein